MAKSKKTQPAEKTTAGTSPNAGGKKSAKTKAPATGPSVPMIDTSLAAESVAKFVAAGVPVAPATAAAPSKESTVFKNLKANLSHPPATSMANLLDKTAGPGQKKPNLPFHGGKQVGRNQTFGADVNRTGVPRRTGG